MQKPKVIAFAALAVVTFGSLIGTGGYAWYLRSERYRKLCAEHLSQRLGLPAEIAEVVPRARNAREFRGVRVWLPERRDEAAFCESALLVHTPSDEDPAAYELELRGGHSEISTRTWLRGDYRFVLESGLRPGFAPDGPRAVRFLNMDLTFEHDAFNARLRGASGALGFEDPHSGRATVTCAEFNGLRTISPVVLRAEFSPQPSGVRLDQVELRVPDLPLRVIGLARGAGVEVRSGSFGGRLVYRETDAGRELAISGRAADLRLEECTAPLLARPWRGAGKEIELQELTFAGGVPQRVAFRGVLTEVELSDVLAPWGCGDSGGQLVLRVHAAELSPAGIDRLILSAECDHVALEPIMAATGMGRLFGTARLVIDDLTIERNRLKSLDADVRVEQATGASNWIERELLLALLERALHVELPQVLREQLPERFEYAALGVRLDVRDEQLFLFGTHGPREKTILTIRLGGRELPLVFEPEQPLDLAPTLDALRARLAAYLEARWPGAPGTPPTETRPAISPSAPE